MRWPRIRVRVAVVLLVVVGVVVGQGAWLWHTREARLRQMRHYNSLMQDAWASAKKSRGATRKAFLRVHREHFKAFEAYRQAADAPWKPLPPVRSAPVSNEQAATR